MRQWVVLKRYFNTPLEEQIHPDDWMTYLESRNTPGSVLERPKSEPDAEGYITLSRGGFAFRGKPSLIEEEVDGMVHPIGTDVMARNNGKWFPARIAWIGWRYKARQLIYGVDPENPKDTGKARKYFLPRAIEPR